MRASPASFALLEGQGIEPLEERIRKEVAEFVRRIGKLSDEPVTRREMLRQTLRQLGGRLLDEFGDHYALAMQFQILSELAWWSPDALRAAQGSDAPAPGPLVARPPGAA